MESGLGSSATVEGADNQQLGDAANPPGKNKPKDSKLRQQKLPAWQPILTAGTVVPCFFAIGLLFLPLGIAIFVTSDDIFEEVADYTNCLKDGDEKEKPCHAYLRNYTKDTTGQLKPCECRITIPIPKDIEGDVFIYYGLSNYYQNHRRYVNSRSDEQLLGDLDADTSSCAPFSVNTTSNKPIAPCGAIANSLFNDTFEITADGGEKKLNLTWEGVAWPTDRDHKFRNPKDMSEFEKKTSKPPNWQKSVDKLDRNQENNGFVNTDLMVWMRTAALPTFRKLHRRLVGGLKKGQYTARIGFNYPVDSFYGSKRLIVSTASWVGGKNSFLGVAYIVVGSLCLLLGVVFLVIHLKFGRSLTEMSAIGGRS